ncbi:MAG: hypothetical protein ACI841_004262 [Planctomycetota bacterium]|jgi:hypothetical protein
MKLHPATLLASSLLILASSCGSTRSVHASDAPGAQAGKEKKVDVEALEHKIKIAQLQLAHADLELTSHESKSAETVRLAHVELELATAKHAKFASLERESREIRSALSLQRSRDRATESEEELRQLEIMYRDQDLDDLTSEFVINRGKRDTQRTKASLDLQERDHKALMEHDLPSEKKSLDLDLSRKQYSVETAELAAKSGSIQKEISLLKAQSELKKLEKELSDATESDQ